MRPALNFAPGKAAAVNIRESVAIDAFDRHELNSMRFLASYTVAKVPDASRLPSLWSCRQDEESRSRVNRVAQASLSTPAAPSETPGVDHIHAR